MTKNIKEIGKELLGKSLNSFHRKTGLTQLEKNNEMQDGILDGILSQVDNAYIEKTEQSNVIHLDGSGDGVVVLDSIEGNTMVNLWDFENLTNGYFSSNNSNTFTNFFTTNTQMIKPNTKYTCIVEVVENTLSGDSSIVFINDDDTHSCFSYNFRISGGNTGVFKTIITSKSDLSNVTYVCRSYVHNTSGKIATVKIRCILLEGDYTDKDTNYFKGLQSSFEENKEDDKYKIEILMKNKNLIDTKAKFPYVVNSTTNNGRNVGVVKCLPNTQYAIHLKTNNEKGVVTCVCSPKEFTQEEMNGLGFQSICYNYSRDYYNGVKFEWQVIGTDKKETILTPPNTKYIYINSDYRFGTDFSITSIQLEKGSVATSYTKPKYNKIKLLLNEPLRAIDDIKDKLCIKDGKLVVERNTFKDTINGSENWIGWKSSKENCSFRLNFYNKLTPKSTREEKKYILCKSLVVTDFNRMYDNTCPYDLCISSGDPNSLTDRSSLYIRNKNFETTQVTQFKQWLSQNNIEIIGVLAEPYYEEVLNEYGEPILMEGYENGTLYIDSTIVPITTVRYTPKMESFKTIKEVKDNNIMLTSDINDMIVPYMMEVDLMIMEKEVALMSKKNIRKIGAEDMTSMQKRTQQMLERLIKGRTLTEQECQTRVTTYLNANKITDEQAEELMLLISEVYA